jgi:hypothetical protein
MQATENASLRPVESSSQERYHRFASDNSSKKIFSPEEAAHQVSIASRFAENALNPDLQLLISDICSVAVILNGLSDSIRTSCLEADTIASAAASIVSDAATKSELRWSKAVSSERQINRQFQAGIQTISSELEQIAFDLQRLQISSVATLQQYIAVQSEYQHVSKDKIIWQSKAISLEEEIKTLRESCSQREHESRDNLVAEQATKVDSARLLADISVLTKENHDLQRQLNSVQVCPQYGFPVVA